MLVQENLQSALQVLHFVAEFEVHWGFLSAGEAGALLKKARDALLETLTGRSKVNGGHTIGNVYRGVIIYDARPRAHSPQNPGRLSLARCHSV